jgi:hypothetical protein
MPTNKIQSPGKKKKKTIQHSEQGESLKSRIHHLYGEEDVSYIRKIKFSRRGITQKKAYNIQNKTKV